MGNFTRILRVALAAGSLFLAVSLGYPWWQSYSGSREVSRVHSFALPNPEVNAAAETALTCRRIGEGETSKYELHYSMRLTSSPGQALRVEGSDILQMTLIRADARGTLMAGKLRGEHWVVESGDPMLTSSTLSAELSRSFGALFDSQGRLVTTLLDPAIGMLSQGLLRSLVGSLQFVRADGQSRQDSWSVSEADAHGEYTALYARLEPRRFAKRKLDYRPARSGAPRLFPQSTQLDSSSQFLLGSEHDCIENVSTRETFSAKASSGGASGMNSESTLAVQLTGYGSDADRIALDPALVAFAAGSSLAGPVSARTVPERMESILAAHDPKEEDLPWERIKLLAELFRQRASEIDRATRFVPQTDDRASQRAILSALGEEASERAQAALADLARMSELAAELRQIAILQLGLIRGATAGAILALRDLASAAETEEQLRTLALMALGSASRSALAVGDGNARNAAMRSVQSLRLALERAVSPEDRALLLDALGNSGAPTAGDVAAAALLDESPSVRGSAVHALRLVTDRNADRLIGRTAREDPSTEVRVQAILTLGSRPILHENRRVLLDALRGDAEGAVRAAAILTLEPLRAEADVRAALERVAREDASQDARAVAHQMLSTEDPD